MKNGSLITLILMILVVFLLSSCATQQKTKTIRVNTMMGKIGEEQSIELPSITSEIIMKERGSKILNPYFLIENATGDDMFKVDHGGNVFLPQTPNCDSLDTNSFGVIVCGTDAGATNTSKWDITGSNYLIDNSNILEVNETKLNETIDLRNEVKELTTYVSVSGGSGTNDTSYNFPSSSEILRVSVFPTTNTTQYRFSSNTTTTGDFVDKDLIEHIGDWKIAHMGSTVSDETISFHITNSTTDEMFNITVRYR